MDEKIYKIIELINKEIGNVPVDENGFYSRGDAFLVVGLNRAKDIILKVAKEEKRGK